MSLIAVITGDIVDSQRLQGSQWDHLYSAMDRSFARLARTFDLVASPSIFRGDGIQIALKEPRYALLVAVWLRLSVRAQASKLDTRNVDVRLSVGIGTGESHGEEVSRGAGSAFVRSGRGLELISSSVRGSWMRYDDEDPVRHQVATGLFSLLDAVIRKSTDRQCLVVLSGIEGIPLAHVAQEEAKDASTFYKHELAAFSWAYESAHLAYTELWGFGATALPVWIREQEPPDDHIDEPGVSTPYQVKPGLSTPY